MKLVRNVYAYTGSLAAGSMILLGSVPKVFAGTDVDFDLAKPQNTDISTAGGNVSDAIESIANAVYPIFFLVAGIAAVFYLLYMGFLYITSAGDPEKAKKARGGIVSAVIGIVIILAAFFIIRFALAAGNTVDSTTIQ